jgi:three-Cys-motif partner protein
MASFGGAWSEQKLSCVEAYTARYLQVMQKQSWATLHYVDAFAGRGKQLLPALPDPIDNECIEATANFLEGSAIRALNASSDSSRGFDKFIFIEANRTASVELELNVRADFPKIKDRVEILRSDANKALCEYIDTTNWNTTGHWYSSILLGWKPGGTLFLDWLPHRHATSGTFSLLLAS